MCPCTWAYSGILARKGTRVDSDILTSRGLTQDVKCISNFVCKTLKCNNFIAKLQRCSYCKTAITTSLYVWQVPVEFNLICLRQWFINNSQWGVVDWNSLYTHQFRKITAKLLTGRPVDGAMLLSRLLTIVNIGWRLIDSMLTLQPAMAD